MRSKWWKAFFHSYSEFMVAFAVIFVAAMLVVFTFIGLESLTHDRLASVAISVVIWIPIYAAAIKANGA